MGLTYRFISDPKQPTEIIAWFRSLQASPVEVPTERGAVLCFREFGPLVYSGDGNVDATKSPVVTLFLPRVNRGVLWTVGEVHFLSTPLRRLFPKLHKINSAFSKWLNGHECVWSNKCTSNDYDYYLEGSVRNYDPPVFGFESGLKALKAGRYFVGDSDGGFILDKVCQALRLRGIECAET